MPLETLYYTLLKRSCQDFLRLVYWFYMKRNQVKIKDRNLYPLLSSKDRLMIWEKVRGMWKNRKPDPIKELAKMRKEWERKII